MKKVVKLFAILALIPFSGNAQSWQTVGNENFEISGPLNTMAMVVANNKQYVVTRTPEANVYTYVDGSGWESVGDSDFSDGLASTLDIAYGNNELYTVYGEMSENFKLSVKKLNTSNNTWEYVGTQAFTAGAAQYVSLTTNGNAPYVSYRDADLNLEGITVQTFDGTNWVTVGTPGFSTGDASYTEIEFNNGQPYVVFHDHDQNGKATVMTYDGSTWNNVGNAGFSAGSTLSTQIAFDGNTPMVAFADDEHGYKATVMTYDGTNWTVLGTPGFTNSQVVDLDLKVFNGTTYLAFGEYDGSDYLTSMMRFDGTNWVNVGEAEFGQDNIGHAELDFLSNGTPVVANGGISVYQLCSPLNTNTSVSGITITAENSNAAYQWGLCNNDAFAQAISGETNQTFTPQFPNNDFAVIIEEYGCVDTSACVTISTNSIDELSNNQISVYPNPSNGSFEIDLGQNYTQLDVTIHNISGALLYQESVFNTENISVNAPLRPGVYILNIDDNSRNQLTTRRIVVE